MEEKEFITMLEDLIYSEQELSDDYSKATNKAIDLLNKLKAKQLSIPDVSKSTKEQIKKILMDNSDPLELPGTCKGDRIIDNEDIEDIAKLINQMLQEKIQLLLTKD